MPDYYLDTEFIEDFHKPRFGKKRHFIDLISIGVVAEDDRNYYAVSNEYNYNDASQWVKDNVIASAYNYAVHGDPRNYYSGKNFHRAFGKSNDKIKKELLEFFGCWHDGLYWRAPDNIKVFGYFGDYDWVLFCSIFGKMIDLPKGFPMYLIDLKQMLDQKLANYSHSDARRCEFGAQTGFEIAALSPDDRLPWVKLNVSSYPKQKDEHVAIADARWNKSLHEFIIKL